MSVHPDIIEAFDQIDAAVFSGDTFMTHLGHGMLKGYLERWNKWIAEANYYDANGSLRNPDGSRSIFDDVDE